MPITDIIQLIVAGMALLTLFVLVYQIKIQNDMFKSQLIRDRFDMYWSWQPVTDDDVTEIELFPEEYFDSDVYQTDYQGNRDAIRKYLYVAHVYEYLAFAYGLVNTKIPDPMHHMHSLWLSDMLQREDFLQVHRHIGRYYPDFAKKVERLLNK